MEAVPRMFMISLELKWSLEKVEFGPNLKEYIQKHYMEEPGKYNEEIKVLDQLRVNATNVTRDFNGISTLKKYYGQLHLLTSRFPITEGGEAAPVFTWIDTFHEEPFSHADATFDQACVLYNLGVLHSILGAKESRSSEEEMKVACTHFQCAAGAFSYLKDHFQSYMSPDISFDLMTIYINLMLGQAQECLLEKSMQDNRKSSLVARISMQVIEYYRLALRGLEDPNVSSLMGSRRSKTWKRSVQVKISHFLSVAYTYMSNQADEQQKHGERVCWLQQAVDRHNEAMKLSKGVNDTIIQALNFTKDVVLGKFQAAKKDNDFVYHDAVPTFENLPDIKGASLVKALTFQPYDENIAGPDIFKKLVPMEAHEAASLYSEEKAKLLRWIGDAVGGKSKQLDQFMASLQLDQLRLNAAEEPERLPQVMLEVCAALSVKTDPIKQLVSSMQELSNVVLDVDGDVKELQEILDTEEKQEAAFQKESGQRMTATSLADVRPEFAKYREGHDKASKSNQELHRAMRVHIQNIRQLAGPLEELQASLPSVKSQQTSADSEAESRLSVLIKKVEEMKAQRASLQTQLRDQLFADDITSRIVTTEGGNMKELFEEELKKHDTLSTYIEQNLSAQDNILKALTEANAGYADTRRMQTEVTKRREERIQELIASYTVYDDLLAKSHKGIEFYKKLQQGMAKLLERTNAAVRESQQEREATLARLRPKPAQPRPTAPKPVLPVDPVPAGPKLSDFWKPKSSQQQQQQQQQLPSAGIGVAGTMSVIPGAVAGMYPAGVPAGALPGVAPGGSPVHGAARDPARALPTAPSAPNTPSPSPAVTSLPGGPPRPGIQVLQHQPLPQQQQQQQQQPPVPQSGGLPYGGSSMPAMSQAGPQPPPAAAVSAGYNPQQAQLPRTRTPMQQPMVPQSLSQSQQQPPLPPTSHQQPTNPYLQQQPGYVPTSSQPPQGHTAPHSIPPASMPSNNSLQAQPPTSTTMVSSVTTPIPAAATQMPTAGMHQQHHHQPQLQPQPQPQGPQPQPQGQPPGPQSLPQGLPQPQGQPQGPQSLPQGLPQPQGQPQGPQSLPQGQPQGPQSLPQGQPQPQPGASQQQFRPVVPPEGQLQPSSKLPQAGQLPSGYQHVNQQHQHHPQQQQPQQQPQQQQPQQPNHPMVTQQAAQAHYPITSQQIGQPQLQQPLNYQQPQQLQQQQPGMQSPHRAAFQQQHYPQHPQGSQTPTASPQHGPQQVPYSQPSGQPQPQMPPQQQQQQQVHMQASQTPTASPQHGGRPGLQHPQGMTQIGSGQQQVPGMQQQQPPQQHHPHQQQQQLPFSQAGFTAPSTQQGSPLRQPQQLGQGPQRLGPVSGQQGFGAQQPVPGQTPLPAGQPSSQAGAVGQPQLGANQPRAAGQLPTAGYAVGQQQQPQTTPGGQHPVSVADPPPTQRPGPLPQGAYPQAGSSQVWPRTQYPQQGGGSGLPLAHQQPTQQQQQQQTGPGQPPRPPYAPQPAQVPPPHSGPYPGIQGVVGYASQQPPSQGYAQPGPAQAQAQAPTPPPGQSPSGNRMPPAGNNPALVAHPSTTLSMQTPPVNPLAPNSHHPSMRPPFQSLTTPPSSSYRATPEGHPLNATTLPPPPHMAGGPVAGQPFQPPLNQVQQVNRALKEEQQRLPQPSLRPVKVDPSARDLLSNSPDNEQISLGKPLMPQTQPSADADIDASPNGSPPPLPPTAPTGSSPPSSAGSPPQLPTHPPDGAASALSEVFKRPGQPSPPPAKPAEPQPSATRQALPASAVKPLWADRPQTTTTTTTTTAPASAASQPFPKPKDPYDDKQTLDKFVEEMERFEKYVDGLGKQMLSGPTVLDGLWKELSEAQDRDTRQYSIAVARCYSIKNRHPDVMPYDHNRVKLQSGKDDYINASAVTDLSPASPRFIVTQAPLPSSYNDFWLMVYEHQVSLVVMLVSQSPTAKSKADFDQYWPKERGQVRTYGSIMISLQSKRSSDYQTDRTFHLIHKDTKQERTVFQLQFTAWPEFGVPSRPADLLQYISDVNSLYMQQRSLSTPIVVHCTSGVGQTGTFCLIYSAVREIMGGGGIVDIPRQVKTLRQQRRGMVAEKEQLRFSYLAILCFAQQVLAKRGISLKSSVSSPQVDLKRITSFDSIMGADSVTSLHSRISKMSVRTASQEAAAGTDPPTLQDHLSDPGALLPSAVAATLDSTAAAAAAAAAAATAPSHGSSAASSPAATPDESGPAGGSSSPAGGSSSPAKLSKEPQEEEEAAAPSLLELTETNLSHFRQSPAQFVPDVVGSSQQELGGEPAPASPEGALPSILADLTPQNFSMKAAAKQQQRISKADFAGRKGSLGSSASGEDPLSSLDPLWTMKGKEEASPP